MNNATNISEIDFCAYIDGELDAARAQAVEAQIAADPELARRIEGFKADMAMLKKVYGPLASKPAPREWLALVENSKPGSLASPRAFSWRTVAAIAALLLIALAAVPVAYHALAPSQSPSGEIVDAALTARHENGSHTILVSDDGSQYAKAISSAISEHVRVPDLDKMGYRLSAINFYPSAPGGSAAELVYHDRAGRLFTLYLRHSNGVARFDQFARAGLRVCVWQDDQLGMVIVGNVNTAAMQRLASLAYTGLTL